MSRIGYWVAVACGFLLASCKQDLQQPSVAATPISEASPVVVPPNEIGRYQLTAAPYQLGSDKGVSIELPGVFLVDTKTGATWVYSELLIEGKRHADWRRTEMPDGIDE